MNDPVATAIDGVFRREWGRIVATLIRTTGDWDLAEECTADAFARALERWPRDGVPDNPGAWLTTTARNRALDRLRRDGVLQTKLEQVAVMHQPGNDDDGPAAADERQDPNGDRSAERNDDGISDDRLRLLFTCCHPALRLDARVALTLRTLTGLTTAEIARAFFVPEATMAKRLVRAKAKIRNAGIPYRVPAGHVLPDRLHGVLGVVYLLFNEGYGSTSGGELIRAGLCEEAIRLAGLLVELMPDAPETSGLLALLVMHHARRDGRVDSRGDLVPLEVQDRARWDREAISRGVQILAGAARRGEPGPYQLQAAIAACHATAEVASETDWPRIAGLYRELFELVPTPVVALNRAVAIAMADGPDAGLAFIDASGLDETLAAFHLLPATRADLLRRLGRRTEAAAQYHAALELVTSAAEERYLRRRLAEVTTG